MVNMYNVYWKNFSTLIGRLDIDYVTFYYVYELSMHIVYMARILPYNQNFFVRQNFYTLN